MTPKWKERKVNLSSAIIGGAVTLALGLTIGLNWRTITTNVLPYIGFHIPEQNDWGALDAVYDTITSNYDGTLDFKTLLEGAKRGMVAAVGDKYTEYMNSDEATAYEASLHGQIGAGIGIEMGLRDGYVRVIRTLPDNPARRAGILSGDIIYKINGEEVYQLDTEAIAGKLRGTAGSTVQLTIVRDGKEHTYDLTRETINNVSADVDYDGSTAIITVSRFDTDTGTIVKQFAEDFEKRGVKQIILDLRGNGGGYVTAARDLLSLWIDGEPVVIQKSQNAPDSVTRAKRGEAILADFPTVVLVDGTTASASEIVAGALKDYNKATLIGQTTYGKGVVQTLLNIGNGEMIKVTTARWYTPHGENIDKTGIKPDQEVTITYEDINAGRDPQLTAAQKFLNSKKLISR